MLKYYAFMQNLLAERLSGDRGATAVEYGLIVTLIAVAIIAVVFTVGQNLLNEFTKVANAL
jgi:pilus assembly protein Flp/PilA